MPLDYGRNFVLDDVTINVSSMSDAVSSIVSAVQDGDSFCVYTLNLDHFVKLRSQPDFRAAYQRARFVTADGFPIVILGRLAGAPMTRTTGADLVEPLCGEATRNHLPIFLFGSTEASLHKASTQLWGRFGELEIVGYRAPSRDFDPYSEEADAAIERIRASGARFCFVALGAPKQEIFAARCLDRLSGIGLICVGAALDFIAGTQSRAPRYAQKAGLEWLWRMMQSPSRLGPRYARCLLALPGLVAQAVPQTIAARLGRLA